MTLHVETPEEAEEEEEEEEGKGDPPGHEAAVAAAAKKDALPSLGLPPPLPPAHPQFADLQTIMLEDEVAQRFDYVFTTAGKVSKEGRKGGRERGREGGKERGRKEKIEGGREGRRDGKREGGRERE